MEWAMLIPDIIFACTDNSNNSRSNSVNSDSVSAAQAARQVIDQENKYVFGSQISSGAPLRMKLRVAQFDHRKPKH